MLFFLDSADVKEIEDLSSVGIIDGVTTNPSLLSKNSGDFYKIAKDICAATNGPVSLEVGSTDYEGMLTEGEKILSIASNVVLKLPTTWDGIKVCSYFASQGKDVNMTLCFSVNQALLAAKAGAAYISPFIGRLDDIGQDGLTLVEEIHNLYLNYEFTTKILAASIRNPYHLYQVAQIGAQVATMPSKVIRQLVDHPLTDIGLKNFSSDWLKSGLKI